MVQALQVSDQSTAQTLSFTNSFLDSAGFTGGRLRFQVYSATANDSDQIAATTPDLAVGAGATLEFEDLTTLGGVPVDYVGTTY